MDLNDHEITWDLGTVERTDDRHPAGARSARARTELGPLEDHAIDAPLAPLAALRRILPIAMMVALAVGGLAVLSDGAETTPADDVDRAQSEDVAELRGGAPDAAATDSSTASASVLEAQALTQASVERQAAEDLLLGNIGVAMTMCNAMTKYFDETPAQVEKARRYAACLDGFEIPFRLPTEELHPAYGFPRDTEPAVLLHCGSWLTGPDISTAAYAGFELCADEAEVLYGLA